MPDPTTQPGSRDRLALAGVLLACVIVPTAVSGSGVLLPRIGASTGAGTTELQWVVNAFNLAFAASTLLAGSLADLFGRQRGFAVGVALYLVASVLSAVAGDVLLLDVSRAVAGLGAAAIFACGSALLAARFEGPAQVRAFALLGTAAGVGLGVGPTVAGLLADALGWQSFFAAGAVAATGTLALLWVSRTPEPVPDHGLTVDRPGAVTFVLGLLLVMVAIVQASAWGWTSAATLLTGAAGLVLLAVFGRIERGTEHPLLDTSLLRDRQLVGLILVPVVAAVGFVTLLTYLPSYLHAVWGDGTGAAGVKMLFATVPVIVAPLLAGVAVGRGATPRAVILASLVVLVAGPALLLLVSPDRSFWVAVPGMVLIGAGFGLGVGLVDGQAIGRAPAERAGMAAGLVNTSRLGSEAVAVAAYGSVLASLTGSYDTRFHTVVTGLVAITAVLALLTAWLLRPAAPARAAAGTRRARTTAGHAG